MRLTNKKGFTLIELAIVLVIVGILLGFVLRSPDLIDSAKTKKVRNIPKKWEVPIWTFYDKRGHFPGDTNTPPDGVINSFSDLKNALGNANIGHPPDSIEGVTVSITGLANVCAGGATVSRNVMLIGAGTTPTLDADFARRIDEDIDGQVDGTRGRVRNCGNNGTGTAAAWPASGNVVATFFFDRGL